MPYGSPLKYNTTWTGVGEFKVFVANQLHPVGIIIWCVFMSVGIFCSVFVDGTVTSEDLSRICPYPDGILYFNTFSLVLTRRLQTSHK
jgi:hypothetical protein